MTFFWILIGLIVGHIWGWEMAHYRVAHECRVLGGFYVGKAVFRCVEINPKAAP